MTLASGPSVAVDGSTATESPTRTVPGVPLGVLGANEPARLDVDEMIDWILFQQFALGTHGESVGLTEPAIRGLVSTYIARSLQPL